MYPSAPHAPPWGLSTAAAEQGMCPLPVVVAISHAAQVLLLLLVKFALLSFSMRAVFADIGCAFWLFLLCA
jgi:hypothetical protein